MKPAQSAEIFSITMPWRGRGGDLHNQCVTRIVPREDSFGVAGALNVAIAAKLVVPDKLVVTARLDLIVGRPNWVSFSGAHATGAL